MFGLTQTTKLEGAKPHQRPPYVIGPLSVEYLVIAGGGSALRMQGCAGGGAGGVRSTTELIRQGQYSIVVGAGGAPAALSGTNSSVTFGTTFSATGGGRGGGDGGNGLAGGSGGGGGNTDGIGGAGNAGSYSPVEGFGGGNFTTNRSGSGGGAGGAGANGSTPNAIGGIGTNTYSDFLSAISSVMPAGWQSATSSGYIAGGGGAGAFNNNAGGAGGAGGGGAAGGASGTDGVDFTGSGGGGTDQNGSDPGNGGSGLVVIRYAGGARATGGDFRVASGGYTYHVFKSSANFNA